MNSYKFYLLKFDYVDLFLLEFESLFSLICRYTFSGYIKYSPISLRLIGSVSNA